MQTFDFMLGKHSSARILHVDFPQKRPLIANIFPFNVDWSIQL